jgi:hypothetical protein
MAKQISLTYSVLDSGYQNASIQEVLSLLDASASPANVGTIDNPVETGFPLLTTDPDPKMFSYVYRGSVHFLVSKVVTPVSGTAPYTTWSMASVSASGVWSVMAKDVVLRYPDKNGAPVATNSYGVAPAGDRLYIVDSDSQKIYTLGMNELNGLQDTFHTLNTAPFDLGPGTDAGLDATAKGQAVIVLQDTLATPTKPTYLFALFTDYTVDPVTEKVTQTPGHLVRMTIDATTGALTYQAQCLTALNPQEIVPLTKSVGTVILAIPSVGGDQQAGGTNGTASMVQSVPAFATWPITAVTRVTGAESGTYDIFAIAAPDRAADGGIVYILTHDYTDEYAGTNWRLYSTTVDTLLNLPTGTTLATAGFAVPDSDTSAGGSPGYFWNIFVETGATDDADRLWFFRGSPILATPAKAYAPPPQTGVTNRFFDAGTAVGQIGGQNVDWVDFTAETVRQAGLGKSLKHSVRAAQPPAAATAAEEAEEK